MWEIFLFQRFSVSMAKKIRMMQGGLTKVILCFCMALSGMDALAAGDPVAGKTAWDTNCRACHGGGTPATAGFLANPLSFYADSGANIAGSASPGYNYSGGNTSSAMGGFTGMLGTATAPTVMANNIAAYIGSIMTPTARAAEVANTQAQIANIFGWAQIINFRQRLESRHRAPMAGGTMQTAPQDRASGPSFWTSGLARFGQKGQDSGGMIDFNTSGISFGMDMELSEELMLGMGVGYARDKSTVGSDGSGSKARGRSVTAYGGYHLPAGLILDGLLGYGDLNFSSNRYVSSAGTFARMERGGQQIFSMLTLGGYYRGGNVMASPYIRYEFSGIRLDAASEDGGGSGALYFGEQKLRSSHMALGFRSETNIGTSFGAATPRLKLEYLRNMNAASQEAMYYLNAPTTRFDINIASQRSNSMVFGLGSDFVWRNGWRLGLDGQFIYSSRKDKSIIFTAMLIKALDEK